MIQMTVDCSSETTENRGNSTRFFKYLKGRNSAMNFVSGNIMLQKGKKIKTFSHEKNTSLSDLLFKIG